VTDTGSGVNRLLVRIQNRNTDPFSYWNGTIYQSSPVWVRAQLDNSNGWQVPNVNFNTAGTYRILIRAYDNNGNQAKSQDNPQALITIEDTNN
jgi:hypothetical protein